MEEMQEMLKKIETILAKDPSYKFEAYSFVLAGLHYTVNKLPSPRHVSGQELCEGLREYALQQFGPLARTVLEYWGIRNTKDFGKVVFHLIDVGLLRKNEGDSLADFDSVFDFSKGFHYEIKEEREESS